MIPAVWSDLLAAAFQCLPAERGTTEPPAILADRRGALSLALCAADQAGTADWPADARALVHAARAALLARVPVIDRETYRAATHAQWAAPAPKARHPWQERADLA